MIGRETEAQSSGITRVKTTDGRLLSYSEGGGGVRFYRGAGNLGRLSQQFDPSTFRRIYGSWYGDSTIEHKLAGLVIVGTQGVYYGLDTNDLNLYMRATGGIFPVEEGEEYTGPRNLNNTVRLNYNRIHGSKNTKVSFTGV